jgi:hypothetical protein
VGYNLEAKGSSKGKNLSLTYYAGKKIPCSAANMHIKVSAQCPICEIGVEDTQHILFHRSRAKLNWRKLGWRN